MPIAEAFEETEEIPEYYWIFLENQHPIIGEFVSKTLFQTNQGLMDINVINVAISGPIDPPEDTPPPPEPAVPQKQGAA